MENVKKNDPHSANSAKHTLALGLRARRLVIYAFGDLLVSGLLHGFLRARCLFKKAPLLLFGVGGRIRNDAAPGE